MAALVAAVAAGLLPAVRASNPHRHRALESARSSLRPGERRLLGGIATLQVVLTVALLAGAALLMRTAQNLAAVRPGYDIANILTMSVTSVEPDRWRDFHTRALERVSALPGVRHAAFVWGLPLTGDKWPGDMEIVGQAGSQRLADRLTLPLRSVTPTTSRRWTCGSWPAGASARPTMARRRRSRSSTKRSSGGTSRTRTRSAARSASPGTPGGRSRSSASSPTPAPSRSAEGPSRRCSSRSGRTAHSRST